MTKTQDITIFGEAGVYSAQVTSANRLKVDIPTGTEISPVTGKYISLHLETIGGSRAMNVNGSVTPVKFFVKPPVGKKYYVYNISFMIVDNNINWSKFGGIAGGITNGISVQVTENSVTRIINDYPIKQNRDFTNVIQPTRIRSAAKDILNSNWVFSSGGTVEELNGDLGDEIFINVSDDLTPLNVFRVVIQGYEV